MKVRALLLLAIMNAFSVSSSADPFGAAYKIKLSEISIDGELVFDREVSAFGKTAWRIPIRIEHQLIKSDYRAALSRICVHPVYSSICVRNASTALWERPGGGIAIMVRDDHRIRPAALEKYAPHSQELAPAFFSQDDCCVLNGNFAFVCSDGYVLKYKDGSLDEIFLPDGGTCVVSSAANRINRIQFDGRDILLAEFDSAGNPTRIKTSDSIITLDYDRGFLRQVSVNSLTKFKFDYFPNRLLRCAESRGMVETFAWAFVSTAELFDSPILKTAGNSEFQYERDEHHVSIVLHRGSEETHWLSAKLVYGRIASVESK